MSDDGHLFVVRGDLRRVSCDAWLMPCDEGLHVEGQWLVDERALRPLLPSAWPSPAERVARATSWPEDRPTPFLVDVTGSDRLDHVEAFVARAAEHVRRARPPRFGREKHLLAVPLVGTGKGGAGGIKGDVVRGVVPLLERAADRHGVDLALVLLPGPAYAAVQTERAELDDAWAPLDRAQRELADDLATRAARGKLVLFVGAGVSRSAGLPLWDDLVIALARDAGMQADELAQLAHVNVLDRAKIVARRFGDARAFQEAIARQVDRPEYALTHALLASLPVHEGVTTNYDELFERAWHAALTTRPSPPLAVSRLPHEPRRELDSWLLKLHGCVSARDDLVFTREDYMRYADRRAALAGIVQALLLTRHMLFVGFSLEDDNFHRIVDAVRKACGGAHLDQASGFGTVLDLVDRPIVRELWKDELGWMTFPSPRCIEIFLDYLGFRAARATGAADHLLDPTYAGVRSPADERLRAKLLDIAGDGALRGAEAWPVVEGLLQRLGGRGR